MSNDQKSSEDSSGPMAADGQRAQPEAEPVDPDQPVAEDKASAVDSSGAATPDEDRDGRDEGGESPAIDGELPEGSELTEETAIAQSALSAPARGGGRALAALALLLAFGATGGAGYLYYELIYLQSYAPIGTVRELARVEQSVTQNNRTKAELASRLDTLQGVLAQFDETQATRSRELEDSIATAVGRVDRQLEAQQAALLERETQLVANFNQVLNQAPPSRAEWKIAEVEYLLRIANHRVLMENDAGGGLQLLQAADAILAELDDFGFHQVRAQLAEEILSLKRVGEVDAQGVYLRLEAIKRELDGLPLAVPELLTRRPSTTLAADAGLWQRILDQFTPYFAYRSELKTRIEPLLAPDEIVYLELNLRLMLEQAQLASLRAQQEIFEQSIDNAADWMRDYLNVEDPAVSQLVVELEQLRDTSVLRDLPDISGSLRSLLATERGTS